MLTLLFLSWIVNNLDTASGTFCDDRYECQDDTITDAAYCYGYYGCDGAKIDGTSAYCSGMAGCYDASEITTSGLTACYGYRGCYGAGSITAGSSIYCDGWYGCYGVDGVIEAETYVYCDGDNSCRADEIESGSSTYCNGHYACYQATIQSDDDVSCDGDYGCGYATISAADNIYCYGKFACRSADMSAADYLYAYGAYAAYYSTIEAERVYAYGMYAVAYATLDSTDELGKNVYCYGYRGGYGAEFICRSGSTCNLYCQGTCCYNMDYVCLSGSTCSLSCSADGVSCPAESTSLTTDDDTKLLKYLENKKQERENDDVFIEIQQEIANDDKRFKQKTDDLENNMDPEKVKNNAVLFEGGKQILSSYNNSSSILIAMISSLITFICVYSYFAVKYKNYEYKSIQ